MNVDQTLFAAAEIASAYLKRNTLKPGDIAPLVHLIHTSLSQIEAPPPPVKQEPAVPVKNSIAPDYLICLEDGRRVQMLKRYLRTRYGMTPQQYRAKWDLPFDYPMAAPNYTLARSKAAVAVGFGKRKGPRRPTAQTSDSTSAGVNEAFPDRFEQTA